MSHEEVKVKTLEEIENATDVLSELLEHYEGLKEVEFNKVGLNTISNAHYFQCPRCQIRTRVLSGYSYCMDCNWDSLTDPSNESYKCAA